ncbi:helix-turn-helix domain-containing protein [Actinomycetes bacterium KLBMP 9797]
MSIVQQMPENFAAELRRLRSSRRLTQQELADAAGLSVRSIREMEQGRVATPQPRSAAALAEALKLDDRERRRFLSAARVARIPRPAPPSDGAGAVGPPAFVVPRQLPADLIDMTGREEALAPLIAQATAADRAAAAPDPGLADRAAYGVVAVADREPAPAAPVILAIHGPPGVGKTSLAVAAGHRLATRYPDGQLFIDLRGTAPEPVDPAEALAAFLRTLGAAGDRIPATPPERAALYRTLAHDRRLLVVLDNAADEAQVRPLLPAGSRCLVLVTSRRPLSGLAAVRHRALDVLPEAAGHALLRSIVDDRADAEPEATAELARLCGGLPLALRIAGNRLASRPGWSVAYLADQLRDQQARLTALTAGDLSVRAAFAVSYGQLSEVAAALFRRTALVVGADFGVDLAAEAAGVPRTAALPALEELVDAGLLGTSGERYQFHDLVRLYARERLAEDEAPAGIRAAEHRMVDWLLCRTAAAGASFAPEADPAGADSSGDTGQTADPTAPAGVEIGWPAHRENGAWLAREAAHWWPALRAAARAGRHADVVRVVRALHWYSDVATHQHPWHEIFQLGVTSARAAGDREGEAVLLNFLGWALYFCQDRNDDGIVAHRAALAVARAIGDQREEAWALTYLASITARTGDPAAAVAPCERAVALFTTIGYRAGLRTARGALASALAAVGRIEEALDMHRAILASFETEVTGAPGLVGQAAASLAIGGDQAALGRWAEAAAAYAAAADLFARSGTGFGQAHAAYRHGLALRELGDEAGARVSLHRAADLFAAAHSPARERQARAALHHPDPGRRQAPMIRAS